MTRGTRGAPRGDKDDDAPATSRIPAVRPAPGSVIGDAVRQATASVTGTGALACFVPGPDADPSPQAQARASEAQYFQGYRREQAMRAVWYITTHLSDPDVISRAAVICAAPAWAGDAQRLHGVKGAPVELMGAEVKCAGCRRIYVCLPEDDYYLATSQVDGRCFACVLGSGRHDSALPVLTGAVVGPPEPASRPRQPRKRAARPRAATSTDPLGPFHEPALD